MLKRRPSLRVAFSNPRTNGVLKAECEREHQHEEAQETQPRPDEQRDHRCDRIFYVATWLVHLLSPLFGGH